MPLSDSDYDLIARTMIGEAGDQGPAGQAAVAHVILNRINSGEFGDTPAAVVLGRNQFSVWNNPRAMSGISRE